MPDPREPSRGSGAVACTLVREALCVECIMGKTGLDLDPVLGAISALDAHLRLMRTWGRCRSCSKTDRALLKLDDSAGSRRMSAVQYDGPERHSGLLCARCGKRVGLAGQRVVLRLGQPYHPACAECSSTMSRTDETEDSRHVFMPRDSTNERDAAGDPICPVCGAAMTITDGLMRIGDSNEVAHIRCAVDRRNAAERPTGEQGS